MRQIEIILKRDYTNSGNGETKGILMEKGSNRKICETLERPRFFQGKENVRDNKKTIFNESCCIPEGVYLCVWEYSTRFKKFLYELYGVERRSEVKFHAANVISQLQGCIAPCLKVIDMPKKPKIKVGKTDKLWADASEKGLEAIYNYVGKDENGQPRNFTLTIIS